MDRVVHTKTYGNNNIDARDDVNGDIPEVEKANNVNKGEQDNTQHHQADPQVGQENKGDDENTENS